MGNSVITSDMTSNLDRVILREDIDMAATVAGTYVTIATLVVQPASAASKILLIGQVSGTRGGAVNTNVLDIYKNGSPIQAPTSPGTRRVGFTQAASSSLSTSVFQFIDTAGTTSPITYMLRAMLTGTAYQMIRSQTGSLIAIRLS